MKIGEPIAEACGEGMSSSQTDWMREDISFVCPRAGAGERERECELEVEVEGDEEDDVRDENAVSERDIRGGGEWSAEARELELDMGVPERERGEIGRESGVMGGVARPLPFLSLVLVSLARVAERLTGGGEGRRWFGSGVTGRKGRERRASEWLASLWGVLGMKGRERREGDVLGSWSLGRDPHAEPARGGA